MHVTRTLIPALLGLLTITTASASHPAGLQSVTTPEIPHSVVICNQHINLDDEDKRQALDRELTSMAFTHANTMLLLKRAPLYKPLITRILRENGLPEDLFYLACVESTLDPFAMSGAKAAGLWQFIPSTAKEYGLQVDEYVDQRFDPELSTRAAARYLKKALARYGGDWPTAMGSYNCGQGRMSRDLEAQRQSSAMDLWLPTETTRYIYRIMAMKELMENPSRYGFHLTHKQLYKPSEYEYVEVSGPVDDWVAWSLEHGITYRTLRRHNPWIRSSSLPNKSGTTYRVAIPKDQINNDQTNNEQ